MLLLFARTHIRNPWYLFFYFDFNDKRVPNLNFLFFKYSSDSCWSKKTAFIKQIWDINNFLPSFYTKISEHFRIFLPVVFLCGNFSFRSYIASFNSLMPEVSTSSLHCNRSKSKNQFAWNMNYIFFLHIFVRKTVALNDVRRRNCSAALRMMNQSSIREKSKEISL